MSISKASVTHDLHFVRLAVCDHYGVTLNELVGRSRRSELVRARQLAMWLARKLEYGSFPAVGRAFGRDHSTVVLGVRVAEERMRTSERYRRDAAVLLRAFHDAKAA